MADEAENAVAEAIVPVDAGETIETLAEDTGSQTPSDIDSLASEMGWAPKDQWRGNPEDWKDAKAFLKTTVDINRTLSKDVRELKQTTQRMAKTSAAMMERALAEQREDWESRFDAAVARGDTKAARQATAEIAKLEEPAAEAPDTVKDFEARNPWFKSDKVAAAFAFSVCEANKTLPADEQLKLAEEAVRKRFPEHFPEGEKKKSQPAVNDPGTRTSSTPKGKTFADLPRDAQAACMNFEKKGMKRADYVKSYFEENA